MEPLRCEPCLRRRLLRSLGDLDGLAVVRELGRRRAAHRAHLGARHHAGQAVSARRVRELHLGVEQVGVDDRRHTEDGAARGGEQEHLVVERAELILLNGARDDERSEEMS